MFLKGRKYDKTRLQENQRESPNLPIPRKTKIIAGMVHGSQLLELWQVRYNGKKERVQVRYNGKERVRVRYNGKERVQVRYIGKGRSQWGRNGKKKMHVVSNA